MLRITFIATFSAAFTLYAQPENGNDTFTIANRNYASYMHVQGAVNVDTAKIIGFAVSNLYQKQPECPLGNLMADCMKLYGEKLYKRKVDAAFINYGSIRSYVPKGDIKISNIYKVMPYDNSIVLVKLKGEILAAFLNHVAALGGWPCAGITFNIKDKAAINVIISNEPLDEVKTYTIAVSDYIANGGNECSMLKGLPQANNHYLYRDALIDYIAWFTTNGNPADAKIEGRIVNDPL